LELSPLTKRLFAERLFEPYLITEKVPIKS